MAHGPLPCKTGYPGYPGYPGNFLRNSGDFLKFGLRAAKWRANQNLVFCMQYEIGGQRFIFGVGVPCGGLGTYVGGKGLP